MKESHNLVINITFFVFLVIMLFLNYNNFLESKLDFNLSILAIVISLMLLISKNNTVCDVTHFLYCFIYLFSVTFLSENLYLLALNVLMLTFIIFTRYYFNGCLLSKKQNHSGFFVDLNDIVKKYLFFWNWDYLFPGLMLVSLGKLIKLKGYTINL